MIDLTPIDIRKKAGDFKKGMLGYDTAEVEDFLRLAADRLDELVRENASLSKDILTLKERSERLQQQVATHEERQNAVQEALIMAQKLREDVRAQAESDAQQARQKAESDAQQARQKAEAEIKRTTGAAKRGLEDAKRRLGELDLRRKAFLQSFRAFLEKELNHLETEEREVASSAPLDPEPEAAADSEPLTVPEAVREEVLAALDSMSGEAQPAAEPAGPESQTAAPAASPAPEDPWISALQDVAPYKKREAGPSN
jgi:DivIVA domain-containing protein